MEISLIMMIVLPLLVSTVFVSEYMCDRVRAEAVLSEEAVLAAAGEDRALSGAVFFFLNIRERKKADTAGSAGADLHSHDRAGVLHPETIIAVKFSRRKPVRLLRRLEKIKALTDGD